MLFYACIGASVADKGRLLCDSNTEMQCTFLSSGGSSHCVWLCTLQKRRTCDAVTEEVLCVCVEFFILLAREVFC